MDPGPFCGLESLHPILATRVSHALQKVKATFLLSGWAAGEDGGPARHVVRVVEGQKVGVTGWMGVDGVRLCGC